MAYFVTGQLDGIHAFGVNGLGDDRAFGCVITAGRRWVGVSCEPMFR